jgi:MFS family permease
VMVNELRGQFNLSAEKFGWLTSLYYLAYTPMQVIVGILTDMFGPRKMLTMAVAICTLGSLMFGYSHQLYIAGIGRFLVGFGSAFAFVGVLKLAAIWLPAERFALFAGLSTALGMVGAMVGFVELSILVEKVGWQQTILLSTLVGIVLTPIIWLTIRDYRGVMDPDEATKAEAVTVRDAISGVMHIARDPQMWIAGFIGLALYLSLSVFAETWGISFLQSVYHYTPQQAASAIAMVSLGWLVGAPLMGLISDLMKSRKKPLLIGCFLSILCIVPIIYYPDIPHNLLLGLLFLFGVFSSIEIVCFAIGRENCPHHMAGASVAFVNMLVMLGGFVFQPLVGRLLDLSWTGSTQNGLKLYTSESYTVALSIIPICLVLCLILLYYLRDSFTVSVEEG